MDKVTVYRNATIAEKREVLDRVAAKGQMFHVTFIKADGSIRTMQAKKFVEAALASGDKNVLGVDTHANHDDSYKLVDMVQYKINPKQSWRSLKLDKLVGCTLAGEKIEFEND